MTDEITFAKVPSWLIPIVNGSTLKLYAWLSAEHPGEPWPGDEVIAAELRWALNKVTRARSRLESAKAMGRHGVLLTERPA